MHYGDFDRGAFWCPWVFRKNCIICIQEVNREDSDRRTRNWKEGTNGGHRETDAKRKFILCEHLIVCNRCAVDHRRIYCIAI